MNNKSTIDLIQEIKAWIDANYKTNNSINLSQANTKLSTLTATLGEQVSEAYDLHHTLQARYETFLEKKKKEFIDKGNSSASAETFAKAELAEMKLEATQAKVIHNKLHSQLDRLDKIMDSVKQQVSTINKTEVKRLND
jgi:hypothetical protein